MDPEVLQLGSAAAMSEAVDIRLAARTAAVRPGSFVSRGGGDTHLADFRPGESPHGWWDSRAPCSRREIRAVDRLAR